MPMNIVGLEHLATLYSYLIVVTMLMIVLLCDSTVFSKRIFMSIRTHALLVNRI